MARRLLKKGDRIRLKVRTVCGWKGMGVVVEDQFVRGGLVRFRKEGDDPGLLHDHNVACDHEVALLRDQGGGHDSHDRSRSR